jgi:VanZ family protein
MVTFLLLRPSDSIASPRPFLTFQLTPNDLWEVPGHIIFFSVMTFLWQRAFAQHNSRRRALVIAASLAVLLSVATEAGQHLTRRGALLLDLVANFAGIGLVCLVYLVPAAATRWIFRIAALAWTGLAAAALLRPGDPLVPTHPSIAFELTRSALWDGVGIVTFLTVFTFLWQRVFAQRYGRQRALIMAASLGVLLAVATEILRFSTQRDVLLVDLLASFAGIGLLSFAYLVTAVFSGPNLDREEKNRRPNEG